MKEIIVPENKIMKKINLRVKNDKNGLTWLIRQMSESLFFTFPSIIFSIIALVGSLYFPPRANFASDASLLCCLRVTTVRKNLKQ